jgi:pyridinium-3,5-bisthiocarboxylic acid mononucleotide nickel chelatase
VRIAYFDCIAGISGDMALGSLVDAGADFDALRETLGRLPLEPFSLECEEVESFGLRATKIHVDAPVAAVIRTYSSIRTLLDQAELPADALRNAQRIFRRLAEAEAVVHRKEVELVTFHEVGGVDSIVDIVGTSLAISMLEIERVFASPVPTGFGMARTEHGALPIPGPAVVELLRGAPMYSRGVPVELVTPTGAAILSSLVEGYGDMPLMRVDSVGYGAGEQRLDFPNVTRVIVGEEERAPAAERAATPTEGDLVLETNIDDLNPELYEYVLERLLAAGAQDAWLTPIVMKKSRPAVKISVLCASSAENDIRDVLFRETGTLGVRAMPVTKQALGREEIEVETRFGKVGVKIGYLDGRPVTVAPEFEDCVRVARAASIPAKDVYEEATRLARQSLSS